MKSIQTITLIAALLIVATSCSNKSDAKTGPAAKKSLQADGFIVKSMPFNSELIVTANVLANEQVEIKAPISGQVLNISFNEGGYIRQNSPIVQLDDRIWKAQLVGLNAELDAANSDYNRKKELLEFEGSTQEEVETSFSRIESLKSQIKELEINIDLANVEAPFSGRLGMRDFSKGAFLSTGDVITTLTETNQFKIDFMVSQEYLKSVSIGKEINVLIEGDTLKATVYAINPQINSSSRTVNVRARLKPGSNNTIMPGTFAEVLLSTNYIEDALLIPSQTIVPEIEKQTVYVYENGKAIRKEITMGNRTSDKVHILSGISEGDTLITTGLLLVKSGMDIQLNNVN